MPAILLDIGPHRERLSGEQADELRARLRRSRARDRASAIRKITAALEGTGREGNIVVLSETEGRVVLRVVERWQDSPAAVASLRSRLRAWLSGR